MNIFAYLAFISTLLPFVTAQSLATTAPDPTITTSPPQKTEGYFLNDCPSATGAGYALSLSIQSPNKSCPH